MSSDTKNIVVVGMGYVGIPIAALLADVAGFTVVGLQRRSKRSGWKIDAINKGKSPIEGEEPGLSELIKKVVEEGSLSATDNKDVYKAADIILIDVQTPTDETGVPKYESLKEVSRDIGQMISKDRKPLIIIESTVAPGTTQKIVKPIIEEESGLTCGKDFYLAFSYERLMPGRLIEMIVNMPRVVGGVTEEGTKRAVDLYRKIIKKNIHATDCMTAETSKVIENAYRDVNIAFANQMALACESLGVNVNELREFINERDDRDMHKPGSGVGGHCLPKDTYLLQYGVNRYGNFPKELSLVMLARTINDYMPKHMFNLLEGAFNEAGKPIRDAKVAILGVAYLKDSDDTRNTPAVPLIQYLKDAGAKVFAHDPYVREDDLFRDFPLTGVEFTADIKKACEGADGIALVTEHSEYRSLNPAKIEEIVGGTCVVVDGRNVLDKKAFTEKGFVFRGVGKG